MREICVPRGANWKITSVLGMSLGWIEGRKEGGDRGERKKMPQAIRLEPCSVSSGIAGAGPRDPTFGIGSDA